MKNEPLISIIIPTYNRETLLPKAIESVISQDYSHWELLVIDDFSTDNTNAILKDYKDKDQRINYFINKGRKGPAGARNTGIHYAIGEYIAFLDSDDEWLTHHLSDSINALQEGMVDVCFSFWIEQQEDKITKIFDAENNKKGLIEAINKLQPVITGNRIYFNTSFFEYTILTWFYCYHINTMVIKSGILKKNFFNEKIRSNEDIDLIVRIISHYGFCLIQDYHYIYKRTNSSIYFFIDRSNINVEKVLMDKTLIDRLTWLGKYKLIVHNNKIKIIKKSNSIKDKKSCIKVIRDYLFHVCFTLGYLNKDYKKVKALKYYLQSFRYNYGIGKASSVYIGKLLFPALLKKANIKLPYLDFF